MVVRSVYNQTRHKTLLKCNPMFGNGHDTIITLIMIIQEKVRNSLKHHIRENITNIKLYLPFP